MNVLVGRQFGANMHDDLPDIKYKSLLMEAIQKLCRSIFDPRGQGSIRNL